MSPEVRELITIILPTITGILGVIFGFGGSIIITLLNQKTEERKQIRQLTFNAGIENWKEGVRVAATQRKAEIAPIELFILNMLFLSKLIGKKDISKEELKEFLTRKYETMGELIDILKGLESGKKKGGETD